MTTARPADPALRELLAALLDGLRPPPDLTTSQWAELHRILDSTTSRHVGKWRNERTPYLVEVMDALSPQNPCSFVALMKGAQTGGTEAANNWIGYAIEHDPGPMLVLQSTVEMALDWSRRRLDNLIEKTPILQDLVAPKKGRSAANTLGYKEFRGGSIAIRGANSPAALRSNPIRRVLFDEVDSYPQALGDEGSPLRLAEERTATFDNRKLFYVSTPLNKSTSAIERVYLRSDQRRYYVPCPLCGVYQILEWEHVKWAPGHHAEAHYECESCAGEIQNHSKPWMLKHGQWRATAPGDGDTVGFHLSSLYSPWSNVSWGALATEFIAAKDDPLLLKDFVNLKLGQTWDDEKNSSAPDPNSLEARVEAYPDGECPETIALITAGVDVQDDRVEMEIVGWGAGEESWSLDYHVLYGDPSDREFWDIEVEELLSRAYPHPKLGRMSIAATAVDSGHHTAAVLRYTDAHIRQRRWAIKGRSGKEPIWRTSRGRKRKVKGVLHLVGIDTIKEQVYARLRKEDAGPGFCHFPASRGADYFGQLTAEYLKTTYSAGRATSRWTLPEHRANEALDCRVYATAALHGWYAQGRKLSRAVELLAAAVARVEAPDGPAAKQAAAPKARKPAKQGGWLGGKGKGWLR